MSNTIHLTTCPVCGSADIYIYDYCADYLTSESLFPLSRCRSCGFKFTQAFPSEEHIGKYYANEQYYSHNEAKGLFGLAYRTVRGMMLGKKAALLKKYTAQKGRLLDIGCGQGHFLQKMKTQGFEVFGIEQDEQIAKLAKEKFGIEVHTADWLTKQKDGSFAAITMWHSLEHLQHLNETLQEAKRLLAEDGALVVALPNIDSFDRKYYGLHWAGYDVPRHLWHFSPKTFKILAKKHGFELKKRKAMLFDVFYISILSERNLQSKFATFKGLYFGLRAYLKTLTKAKKASSMIYVLKKKQSA